MYLSRLNKAVVFWAGEIDWWVKVLATKSDDSVSTLGHTEERWGAGECPLR